MSTAKRRYQFGSPVLVPSLETDAVAHALKRIRLSATDSTKQTYDERWLQRLIHRNPAMLPISQLEPGLGILIPVAMELPLTAKYLDNLFVTSEGHLVLVECKLWRNPEARRRVLAQIIDYAQSVSEWSYEQLDTAVRKVSQKAGNSDAGQGLLEIVRNSGLEALEIDEAEFIDAIQRNLKLGRMLLLVVGDGIREDTESLTEFLQQHAGFHFTLALIETALYELPGRSEFLVQARVLARTLNIERAVVSFVDGRLATTFATTLNEVNSATPRSLSEEAYFEKLSGAAPETARALASFVSTLQGLGIFIDVATKSAALKWESPTGRQYALGGVDLKGKLITYSVCWGPSGLGNVEIAHQYLRRLAKLIGAQVRQTPSADQWYLVTTGTAIPPAAAALSKQEEWMDLIADYQRIITEVETSGREA